MKLSSPQVLIGVLLCCTFTCTTSRGNTAVSHQAAKTEMPADQRIDRQALVRRHNIALSKPDPLTPLSVGNGEFAFTADITGLQTFPQYHQQGMALGTQSQWGWHSMPNPDEYTLSDILDDYSVAGRKVPYASDRDYSRTYSPAATWLRANPHRLHLGQIGLRLTRADGSSVGMDDLTNTLQTLDLWTGLLTSRFETEGQTVKIRIATSLRSACNHRFCDMNACWYPWHFHTAEVTGAMRPTGTIRIAIQHSIGSGMTVPTWCVYSTMTVTT